MATCASGDLICTRTFSWWPILYSWIILKVLFCTHISPCLTYSLLVPHPLDLVCTLVSLWPILFIYFSLVSLPIYYGYMCTFVWWTILYTYLLLLTYIGNILKAYSVHILSQVWPFSTNTTCSSPSFYTREFHGLSCFFFFFFNLLVIFYDCLYHCWPFLYTYILLVTYSVNMALFDRLLCTHTPHVGGVFSNYHLFITYFVHMGFFGFFVYLHLGEVVFIWVIFYSLHVNVLVVTYSVHIH